MTDSEFNGSGAAAREPISFLVFSASMRDGSLNTRLAELAARTIEQHGGTVDRANLIDFDAPSYNEDDQHEFGFPVGIEAFHRRLLETDALVIASPEYNASFPGALKNVIDWASRYRPQPFNARHALLISASPSMVGGNRGLWALRMPLEHLGTRVFPDMFSLAQANKQMDEDGRILNELLADRFEKTVVAYMDLVEADKHYMCAKKAWFEYLGEEVTTETERFQ